MIRQKYIDELIKYVDSEQIKILLGMRRTGKSVILEQFHNQISITKNVRYIDFEDYANKKLRNPDNLFEYLNQLIVDKIEIVIIDEIQMVKNFEDILISFRKKLNLFVTGSNSHLLTNSLSSKLSGRFVTINIYPLSYYELREIGKSNNIHVDVDFILLNGSMPYHSFLNQDQFKQGVNNLVETIIYNDILTYNSSIDPIHLKDIFMYLVENLGQEFSIKKIVDTMRSNNIDITQYNVNKILDALIIGNVIHPVIRNDLRGRKKLTQYKKYYISDLIFRRTIFNEIHDIGNVMENLVFTELLRQGYEITSGRNGEYEIDFIATKNNLSHYIQVSYSIVDETTREREVRSFSDITTSYSKILITMDKYKSVIPNSINQISLEEFLIDGLK